MFLVVQVNACIDSRADVFFFSFVYNNVLTHVRQTTQRMLQ